MGRDEDREPFLEAAAEAARPGPGFAERVISRLPKASTGRLVPPVPAPGEKLRAAALGEAARRRRFLRLWGAAAAAAALLTGGTWGIAAWMRAKVPLGEVVALAGAPEARRAPWDGFRALRQGEVLPAGARLRTGAGGLVRLRLPDGSLLDLGPSSRLRLDASRAARLEAGRAWISAAKDPTPWILDTPEGRVRTLGTVFSVSLETENPATPGGAPDTPRGNPDTRSVP